MAGSSHEVDCVGWYFALPDYHLHKDEMVIILLDEHYNMPLLQNVVASGDVVARSTQLGTFSNA